MTGSGQELQPVESVTSDLSPFPGHLHTRWQRKQLSRVVTSWLIEFLNGMTLSLLSFSSIPQQRSQSDRNREPRSELRISLSLRSLAYFCRSYNHRHDPLKMCRAMGPSICRATELDLFISAASTPNLTSSSEHTTALQSTQNRKRR